MTYNSQKFANYGKPVNQYQKQQLNHQESLESKVNQKRNVKVLDDTTIREDEDDDVEENNEEPVRIIDDEEDEYS